MSYQLIPVGSGRVVTLRSVTLHRSHQVLVPSNVTISTDAMCATGVNPRNLTHGSSNVMPCMQFTFGGYVRGQGAAQRQLHGCRRVWVGAWLDSMWPLCSCGAVHGKGVAPVPSTSLSELPVRVSSFGSDR
eukprot:CAMPEP_0184682806 /NCGR_PEP_ID=MMETSP0312-20130426/8873_1 /TAXON_ID=31354 /ORGANISM="Compsopogon coeruleus, Strain SAG 36.94" /LENGTH=130 /DNA_ID=CAMNT_0027134729 /DNA_START=219 /DNA_END=611 /DNA_ORIENTATION=-